jgi:plastocyanin
VIAEWFLAAALLAGLSAPQGTTSAPAPTPVPTGDIKVNVTITAREDSRRVALQNAVVWIPGSKAPRAEVKPAGAARIASRKKRFDPRVTVVPVGTRVEFPNQDKIHHNVFSLSDSARFDLGLYKNGASKPWTFESFGLVRVYCNIHPQMAAYVMVVDGEVYGLSGADGSVTLRGLPPGKYVVRVWDEKGGEFNAPSEVSPGRVTSLSVALSDSGYQDAGHLNKYGKEYPPPDDDDNRY